MTSTWWSIHWWQPQTLLHMEWGSAGWLWLWPAALVLYVVVRTVRGSGSLGSAYPVGQWGGAGVWLLAQVPRVLLFATLAALTVALARPQSSDEVVEQESEGIDILLLLDISPSMRGEDFRPTRLDAAKRTAQEFVAGREFDRIGLVVFAGEAFSLSPLTTDRQLLNQLIGEIEFSMIGEAGTAIGSALAVGINRMEEAESKSKVMVLLSDGDNTAGSISPMNAAQLAKAFGIRVYTIAMGTEGLVYFRDDLGRVRHLNNSLDETTLREIAELCQGQFYRATDNQALEQVFAEIDRLETSTIKERRYQQVTDHYPVYLLWALVLGLAWMASRLLGWSPAYRD